jgi:hypothetical protein
MPEQGAQVEKMGLRRSAFRERDGLPLCDELLRRHWTLVTRIRYYFK